MMTDKPEKPVRWRFEAGEPVAKRTTTAYDLIHLDKVVDTSWLRLLVLHTAFRATEQTEYQRLLSQLRDIERLFIEYPDLEPYYRESYLGDDEAKVSENALIRAGHVASLQAELMEDVFYVLQLDRYANAPDNRGWMNLLRRWGRSKTFNDRLALLSTTYSEEFLQFYDLYIHDYDSTIDDAPIPHPWDIETRREKKPGPMSTKSPRRRLMEWVWTRREKKPGPTSTILPGGFLDSGIREPAPSRGSARSGERPLEQPGTGQHGSGLGESVDSNDEPSGPPSTPPNA
jgi:hypothetical protein